MFAKLVAFTACIPVAVSGCYYQFPHEIKRQPMTPSPAAQIELHDTDHTDYFHDCETRPTGCIMHDGELVRPSHYVETTAKYDGKPITRGQVAELVDPDGQAKRYAELAKYGSTCDVSLVPSTVFAVGALADLVGVGAISSTSSEIPVYLLVGGAIAMVAGAALSYPMGGYACNHGRDVAQHSGIDADIWMMDLAMMKIIDQQTSPSIS